MNNLITSWKKLARETHGNMIEGVRRLNNICGTKVTPTCINEMEKGNKSVPASINRHMLGEILAIEFKNAKFKMTNIDFGLLLENISIPERIK